MLYPRDAPRIAALLRALLLCFVELVAAPASSEGWASCINTVSCHVFDARCVDAYPSELSHCAARREGEALFYHHLSTTRNDKMKIYIEIASKN